MLGRSNQNRPAGAQRMDCQRIGFGRTGSEDDILRPGMEQGAQRIPRIFQNAAGQPASAMNGRRIARMRHCRDRGIARGGVQRLRGIGVEIEHGRL
jgi:hypothetical protein